MENHSKPILIPTDFTVVAQYAVEMAAPFARLNNTGIVLVHIVKKASEVSEATVKVKQEAEKFAKDYGIQVEGIVREGSIFTTIGETVTELDAGLLIMGTHGIRGMQKITGCWALKVIVSSKVPIIVAQASPKKSSIDRIAFPIDYKRENREKIGWAYYVAKLFHSKVYIFSSTASTPFQKKDRKLDQGIKTNLSFTEKFLKSKNIEYEIAQAKGEESFAKETLKYAQEIDADLLLITTSKLISKVDFVLGPIEQAIITNNANIPVMCVNPRKGKIDGFSATGG